MKHFKEHGAELYSSQNLAWYTNLIIVLVNMMLVALLSWKWSGKCLNPKRKQPEILTDLQVLLNK